MKIIIIKENDAGRGRLWNGNPVGVIDKTGRDKRDGEGMRGERERDRERLESECMILEEE
jgi:hypothetical protein